MDECVDHNLSLTFVTENYGLRYCVEKFPHASPKKHDADDDEENTGDDDVVEEVRHTFVEGLLPSHVRDTSRS